jgi:ABC-type multidrug transport system fused ATPase/permease subunit
MANKIKGIKEYVREILKKPEPEETRFRYQDIPFFFRFIKPLWKLGALGLMLNAIAIALQSLLPLSSKVAIDFIVMKKGFQDVEDLLQSLHLNTLIPTMRHFLESINLLVLAMLVLGIVSGVIAIMQRYVMFRFQQELTFNVQTTLFDHLLRFPLSFFKKRQTGYVMARVSGDVHALQYLFSQSLSQIMTSIFRLCFGIAILFALSMKLTLIALIILPFYILINYYFAGRVRSISRSERETYAQVSKDLQEVIAGVEVVKTYTSEEKEVSKLAGRIRTVINTRIKATILSLLSNHSVRAVQMLSTLLIMWFGVHEMQRGGMTIGDYVAFTTYVVYLSGSVNALSLFHLQLQTPFASMDRLMELFKTVPEFDHKEKSKEWVRPKRFRGEIRCEDVSFLYDGTHPVLKNISFIAPPGKVVALVGPSGVGKTTLVNLILKFYAPQSGSIYLDGHDLSVIDPQWLRSRIGVVSQEAFLFNDTIENNIRYGKPSATKEEVIKASRKAHIHEDIEGFADRYETLVGERGTTLSAGQRQRISIARAFLKDPPILIFDEPSSELDAETERRLKDSVKDLIGKRTTFIIAHRFSMIDFAHTILVLEKGRIIERGTHQELMVKGGLYQKLFTKQT